MCSLLRPEGRVDDPTSLKAHRAQPVKSGSRQPAAHRALEYACEKEIGSFLAQEGFSRDIDNEYIGGIVPHAGWYYSGAIACNVIKALSTGSAPDAVAWSFTTSIGTLTANSDWFGVDLQECLPAELRSQRRFEDRPSAKRGLRQ